MKDWVPGRWGGLEAAGFSLLELVVVCVGFDTILLPFRVYVRGKSEI